MRQRLSDDQLREMSGHISYEFQMLVAVGSELIDKGLNPDAAIHNALVESFLLHARQIYQFLAWDDSEKGNDVFAVDYYAEWPKHRSKASAMLKDLLRDVSIRAAHLTLDRIVLHEYRIQEAGTELLREVCSFLALAPKDLFVTRPTVSLTPAWATEQATGAVVTTTNLAVADVLVLADRPPRPAKRDSD